MSQLALEFPSAVQASPVAWESQLLETFRPIHYLGSKLRVVEAISAALDEVDPKRGPVLDLFSGSGTVAMALSQRRAVFANDIQEYSRIISAALLSPALPDSKLPDDVGHALALEQRFRVDLVDACSGLVEYEQQCLSAAMRGDTEPICDLLEHGSLLAAERGHRKGAKSLQKALNHALKAFRSLNLEGSPALTALRYFGGAYFSYAQAAELDWLSHVVNTFSGCRRELLQASLLSATSDVVNTVGKQFAQPIRPRTKAGAVKNHLISKISRDRAISASAAFARWVQRYASRPDVGDAHRAIREDYLDALQLLKGQFNVVYADPPYTRDHYSRFYHVLETLALRDNPEIAKNPGAEEAELSRGLYREDRHQSPFCIKSKAEGAFRELFSRVAASNAALVLSYSPYEKESNARPRLVTVDKLIALARESFSNVQARAIEGVAHSKLNHSSLNYEIPPEAEVLLLCSEARS